jgi:hypothetical protein
LNRRLVVLAILVLALASVTSAANYMYEMSSVKGTGYKNAEKIISTQIGFNGSKLVETESGSGNIITDRTELEAERQIGSRCGGSPLVEIDITTNATGPSFPGIVGSGTGDFGPFGPPVTWDDFLPFLISFRYRQWPTGFGPIDYINFTKQAEFEYMPGAIRPTHTIRNGPISSAFRTTRLAQL